VDLAFVVWDGGCFVSYLPFFLEHGLDVERSEVF